MLCFKNDGKCFRAIVKVLKNSISNFNQDVRMAEWSKAPDSRCNNLYKRVFWSTNVGVGSNRTSDNTFICLFYIGRSGKSSAI